jgi:hypothetical protein
VEDDAQNTTAPESTETKEDTHEEVGLLDSKENVEENDKTVSSQEETKASIVEPEPEEEESTSSPSKY